MGDAMSHAVLPGVAVSFILHIPFFIGAMISGMLASYLSVLFLIKVKLNPMQL